MDKVYCLLIGYVIGSFLTAEIVVYLKTGRKVSSVGSGNPGMTNVMLELGFRSGIIVLLGDMLKTIIACILSYSLFSGLGKLAVLYTGIGTILGHNFPFWNKFKGGKGVTVTCTWLFIFLPVCGLISSFLGFLVVLLTGYLSLGAIVIPLVAIIPCFYYCGFEAGAVTGIAALIMIFKNYKGLRKILKGKENKVYILKDIR